MKLNEQGFSPITLLSVLIATLVVGTGTAVASNSSKPGDVMYGVDRGAEKVQLAFALSDNSKKDLHAALAVERLAEIEDLYAENELDTDGIADAQSNFEEHRAKLTDLSDDDGKLDDHEKELEHSLEEKKSDIDKTAEVDQNLLESEREGLKKQFEQAQEDGDTTKASALKAQIDGFEQKLKSLETERESQKQSMEEQSEAEKKAAEAEYEDEPEEH